MAKELANVERTKIRLGQAGIRSKRDVTLKDAFALYLEWLEGNGKRERTLTFYRGALQSLSKTFSPGRRLSTITTFAIEQHRLALVRSGAKRRQSADLQCLRAVFRKARELGRYNLAVPAIKVSSPKPTKTRVLTTEEEERFLAELGEPHRTIAVLLLNTGFRKSEALSLTWSDVDLVNGFLTVRAGVSKTKESRTLPLNTTLLEALSQHRGASVHTGRDDRVFWNRQGAPLRRIDDVFRDAFNRAGLSDCTIHTTRHSFASRLLLAGADAKTVIELCGWSSFRELGRYAHSNDDAKRRAVESLSETGKKSPQISQQSEKRVSKLRAVK